MLFFDKKFDDKKAKQSHNVIKNCNDYLAFVVLFTIIKHIKQGLLDW